MTATQSLEATKPTGLPPGAMEETEGAHQCLTFVCAGEEYGIDILRVQEI